MRATIFPKDESDPFLHPREVATRLSTSVPRLLIDWWKADERLHEELDRLIENGTPEPILAGHRNLFGNTFWFRADFPDLNNYSIEGWVYLDSAIDLESVAPSVGSELQRRAMRKLADALNYDLSFAD